MLGADGPPLDPSPDEANRWVVEELRKGVYRDEPSLLERLLGWLREHLHLTGGGPGPGLPPWVLYAAVLAVLAVLAVIVLRLVRPDARRTLHRSGGDGVLGGDARSAAELRAAATSALSAGRWDDAVVAGMRAVATGVVERSVLAESPGRTAAELATALGTHFPSQLTDLRRAAHQFDAVRYGHLPADEATARQVVSVEAAVAAARPVYPDPLGVTGGGP